MNNKKILGWILTFAPVWTLMAIFVYLYGSQTILVLLGVVAISGAMFCGMVIVDKEEDWDQ